MNPKELLHPLIHQLESVIHAINESPYISRDSRLSLSRELELLFVQLKEGEIPYIQGEEKIIDLNKRAAADELATLTSKIRSLNPFSPRLDNLHSIDKELHGNAISPDQARRRIYELMNA